MNTFDPATVITLTRPLVCHVGVGTESTTTPSAVPAPAMPKTPNAATAATARNARAPINPPFLDEKLPVHNTGGAGEVNPAGPMLQGLLGELGDALLVRAVDDREI